MKDGVELTCGFSSVDREVLGERQSSEVILELQQRQMPVGGLRFCCGGRLLL